MAVKEGCKIRNEKAAGEAKMHTQIVRYRRKSHFICSKTLVLRHGSLDKWLLVTREQ